MNIKQFLIFKVCDNLPSELKYYIYNLILHESAYQIQKYYWFKVAKNVDIFYSLMYILNNNDPYDPYILNNNDPYISNNNDPLHNLLYSKILKYAYKNLTPKYIESPRVWYDILWKILGFVLNDIKNFKLTMMIIEKIEYSFGHCEDRRHARQGRHLFNSWT